MRYFLVLMVAFCVAIVPTTASADMADCSKKLERSYSRFYKKVAKTHGTRAPGRNIRKQGVRVSWRKHVTVFEATCGELRKSRKQLKKLLAPPVYPTLSRTAVDPAQRPAAVQSSGYTAGSTLQSIAQCESGGNPATNTGNGYYGKYQFDLQTWQSVGGSGLPSSASESEQDYRAAKLYSQRGASPWPVCGR
jgi:hypothetical protein